MIKFKIGDKVKVKYACSNCVIDKIYTVYKGRPFGDGLYIRDKQMEEKAEDGCGCSTSNWELVEDDNKIDKDIKQVFKVGDKVKRTERQRQGSSWAKWCKEDFSPSQDPEGTFEIIDIDESGNLKFKYQSDNHFYNIIGGAFIKVTDDIESGFKIGDKVRVSESNTFNRSHHPIGTIGTIVDIDNTSHIKYACNFGVDDPKSWVTAVELVKEKCHFKVGDKVRFKDKNDARHWFDDNHENLEIDQIADKDGDVRLYNYDKSCSWYVKEEILEHMPKESNPIMNPDTFFIETKVKIYNKEQSKQVQEAMFKKGFKWCNNDKEFKNYITSFPGHLYFHDNNHIKDISYTHSDSESFFQNHSNKEILISDILQKKYFGIEFKINPNIPEGEMHLIDEYKIFDKSYDKSGNIIVQNTSKGGKQNMGTQKTIYKVIVIDRRNSKIVVDKNIASQGSSSAILKAMNSKYNVDDIDHYHFDVTELTRFESEKDDTVKKK